jgi:hypothetical protein
MTQPIQTHISYSAIVVITRQPSDPLRVGNLEFVASTIHNPSDHIYNVLALDNEFHVTYYNHGQTADSDDLLLEDRVIICFGFFNWNVFLQRLELYAHFIIP